MKRSTLFIMAAALAVSPILARATNPAPEVKGLKGRAIPGFTLKKSTPTGRGVVEQWERDADHALLRVEVVPHADASAAESRLKAVNAKIPKDGQAAEELLFRYQSGNDGMAWTNYRATHHATFKTYHFWKLQNGTLVMADLSFPKGKPSFDQARAAFVAAKRAADSTSKFVLGSA